MLGKLVLLCALYALFGGRIDGADDSFMRWLFPMSYLSFTVGACYARGRYRTFREKTARLRRDIQKKHPTMR